MSNTQYKLLEEQAIIVINTWTPAKIKHFAIDQLVVLMMIDPKVVEEYIKFICPECNEFRPDDDRVIAGMKCRFCAY